MSPSEPRRSPRTRRPAAPSGDATAPAAPKRRAKAAPASDVASSEAAPASPKVKAPRKPRAKKPAAATAAPVAPAPVVVAPTQPTATTGLPVEAVLERIVALLRERRAEDVVALDVRGLADYMDFLVLATGRSERQNRAIADGVMRGLRGLKVRPLKRPGPEDGPWISLDFVDVVVHVFDGATRAHYDLENLWGDALKVPLPSPLPPTVG
jgi:ribosome-associated protein